MNQITLFQEHLDTKSDFALFPNVKTVNAKEAHKSMRSVIERLTTPIESETKDTLMIGPYKLGAIPRRHNTNVESISALVFDIDEPSNYSFDDLVGLTSQYSGILHTTWSHTEAKPRFRLIVNLTNQIKAADFVRVRDGFLLFNSELASIIDPSCIDISRAYYLFSYPGARAEIAQCCVLMGEPVNPKKYQLPVTSNNSGIPAIQTSTPLNEVMNGGFTEGSRNDKLAALIGGYISKGLKKEQTLLLATEWNQTLIPPLDNLEVTRTHDSIWKTHYRNHPEDINKKDKSLKDPERQFNLIPASILLADLPPPRKWVIQEFLPSKIVASIIAAGGTGKSFLAMHIAVSVASGSSLFGKYLPKQPSKVVFISGEDDSIELQRRLHKVIDGLPPALKENVNRNLNFLDLADSFELFTEKTNKGEVSITDVPSIICDQIISKVGSEVGLIIIDPISRFRGGEENLAADSTRFVQALQQIRDQLNTCVLTLHHVNKSSGTTGNQNNARGSSAFIDGVRLVYQLNLLSDTELKQYGDLKLQPRLLSLQSIKSNYGKPIDQIILSRRDDGSLEIFNLPAGSYQKKAILQEIKISGLSKTQFKESYGDAKGKFGLSEKALVRKLDELEIEKLIVIASRIPMQLTELGQKMLDA